MNELEMILEKLLEKVGLHLSDSFIKDPKIAAMIKDICDCISNRAPIRFLMSCLLAKINEPKVDIRKPYTEIGSKDSFSGRTYDEVYIQPFIFAHELPCNPTTAYLTPAFRNIDRTLTTDLELVGRPRNIYKATLEILDEVKRGRVLPRDVLLEILRLLVLEKNNKTARIEQLLKSMEKNDEVLPLSAEGIVVLIQQHLACKYASRLPVLVVAAAYRVSERFLGEKVLHLHSHNAADEQTGALGDIEITLMNDDCVVTSYEMKTRRVTTDDLDRAIQKVMNKRIDNYLFITTDVIDDTVVDYAKTLYDKTGGIEFVVLDCIGFLRHFLHLFHRLRIHFLDEYQAMLLIEPHSAVGQPLKEAFLALRRAAQIQSK